MMTDTNISRKNLLHRIHRRLGMYAWKMGLLGYFFYLFIYLFIETESHSVAQAGLELTIQDQVWWLML